MEHAIKRAMNHEEQKEKKRRRKLEKGLPSTAPTPPLTNPPTPGHESSRQSHDASFVTPGENRQVVIDTERDEIVVKRTRNWNPFRKSSKVQEEEHEKIQPNWRDTNPLPTMYSIFKSPTNSISLVASGMSLVYRFIHFIDVRFVVCCPIYHTLYSKYNPSSVSQPEAIHNTR